MKSSLAWAQAATGWRQQHVCCDKACRCGPKVLDKTEIRLANRKHESMTASEWKW
jgi:hypothetical protein